MGLAKNPIVAAILNFVIWGLGYIYLGRKTVFTMLLALGSLAIKIAVLLYSFGEPAPSLVYSVVNDVGFFMVNAAFAYDAYHLAKEPPPSQPSGDGLSWASALVLLVLYGKTLFHRTLAGPG